MADQAKIRQEVWKIVAEVYGFNTPEPKSDKQAELVDKLTDYISNELKEKE